MNAIDYIHQLNLKPHPEGGFYAETFRSKLHVENSQGHTRAAATSIFYLLENTDQSHFHRIQSDEMWFFHTGETMHILVLQSDRLECVALGNNSAKGERLFYVVPAQCWFAAYIPKREGFSLVSCVVAPGFDFADFELADFESLQARYPEHTEIIRTFTR